MTKKIIVLAVTITALPLFAQPVYTQEDLPPIGYEAVFRSDTTEKIIVDVGSTGGPQTWDFGRDVDGVDLGFKVLDPADTPVGDSFPPSVSDMCYYFDNMPVDDTTTVEIYSYYKTSPSDMLLVGDYSVTNDTFDLIHYYDPGRPFSVFPLQMGENWRDSFYILDTLDEDGLITIERWGTSYNEVDAWGDVYLPADTFEALRIITYDTSYMIFTLFVPLTYDTTVTINYKWVTSGYGPLTFISSRNWETDPEFDTAGMYIPKISDDDTTNAVVEQPVVEDFDLTVSDGKVAFQISQAEHVSIEMYDSSGRNVTSLIDRRLTAGYHFIDLPQDLASGVYFIRMNVPGRTLSTKFVVIE